MANLSAKIESLLFHTGEPVRIKRMANLCGTDQESIRTALEGLSDELTDRGITLIIHNETARLVTDPDFSEFIASIREQEVNTNLTNAQSEALAVIAYLAPVHKIKIDFIRGVNSRAVLRNLSVRGLITKNRQDGRMVYDLTSDALAHLGITSQEGLPDYKETRQKLYEFTETDDAAAEMEAVEST